jgi:shikimate kinase
MRNVYLIGMMGSGKTVTGKTLALLLGCGFLDLDDVIQGKSRRTINDLFEKEGEEFFREQEILALAEASSKGPRVIATGGGTVLRPVNIERMKSTGLLIYLETSLETLWSRVKEKTDRPLLKGSTPKEQLEKIFSARKPIYERVCDIKVLTDGLSADVIARQIMMQLEHAR